MIGPHLLNLTRSCKLGHYCKNVKGSALEEGRGVKIALFPSHKAYQPLCKDHPSITGNEAYGECKWTTRDHSRLQALAQGKVVKCIFRP